MMAAFVLDGMPVNATFQGVLSNNIVAEHPDLCSGMRFRIMYELICYGNLNSNRHFRQVLQSEVAPFNQGIPRAIFQQHNARPHVANNV